jgi:hypothetical protein
VGVWAPGVFGNDWTADFAIEFDETEPAERIGLLRRSLVDALEAEEEDELEEFMGAAIGAAAVVAATLPGGPPVGDEGPSDVADLVVPADLVLLALQAFDRVVTDEPEYAEMLDDPEYAPALRAVREALAAAAG